MIDLTQPAIENIHRLQVEYDAINHGLRFGLSGGGCSGYKYVIEFEMASKPDDHIFKFGDIKVFVSDLHLSKLKGSTIGWKEDLMETGFDIDNPQAKQLCGCGVSINF